MKEPRGRHSLLDQINTPEDLRKLEPRSCRSSPPNCAGDHRRGLGDRRASRRRARRRRADGALHHVFDTPRDRLIWDVGHQAYPHKILTGRRDRIRTLRQGGGLSGFTKRSESEYDPFGAAHSSTSISAGLGMAVARDLAGGKHTTSSP